MTPTLGLLQAERAVQGTARSKADLLCEKSRQGEMAGLSGIEELSANPRLRSSASNCTSCIIKFALGEMTRRRART
jgi:hypothetical protein